MAEDVMFSQKCVDCKPGLETKLVTQDGEEICACEILKGLPLCESNVNTNKKRMN